MPAVKPLEPRQLYTRCDETLLDFASTAELPDPDDSFGQARAEEALQLAMDIRRPGYNVFVLGEAGSGRHFTVRRLLEARAATGGRPDDWCYVHNFKDANQPRLLRLPTGRGAGLRRDMQQFSLELATAIGATFEAEGYRLRVEAIQNEYKQREETALQELGQDCVKDRIALLRTPQGFAFAPLRGEETMSPDEFAQLPDDERQRIAALMETYHERLHKLLHQFPRWRREMQSRIREASREAVALAVGHLVDELRERYADTPSVLEFLEEVRADVVETGEELRDQQKSESEVMATLLAAAPALQRYQVNLLVDNAGGRCAPLVCEDHPTFANLVGRFDHVSHLGTLATNFTLIKAGALHRANGGYLLLDAAKLLAQPYAYEGLKRALKSGLIRIESLGQVLGWAASLPLDPQPAPLEVKLVLIGERRVYHLLKEYDPEFDELFKVAAEFDSEVTRDAASTRLYARLIAAIARHHGLRPLERGAVARVIEHGARLAGDAGKLSARSRRIADLLHEADHLAGAAGRDTVARADIERSLEAQRRRAGRLPERLRENVLRETLLIDCDGAAPGQVNGLAVIGLGEQLHGHPVRITATARLGEGELVDIERESELGGAIHTKGVMILAAFLAARYARALPLSLAASLVFEQSYGPVEGDSASLAELCALLSALAALPIRQSLAVTGSVNQHGRVQAIGGVNEKIEGFFEICQARGLTGEQGVLIPASNVKHLMLREDVLRAAEAGRFHIYPVAEVDEAMELLTGRPAGRPDAEGVLPEGSVNRMVAAQLAQMSRLRQEFSRPRQDGRQADQG